MQAEIRRLPGAWLAMMPRLQPGEALGRASSTYLQPCSTSAIMNSSTMPCLGAAGRLSLGVSPVVMPACVAGASAAAVRTSKRKLRTAAAAVDRAPADSPAKYGLAVATAVVATKTCAKKVGKAASGRWLQPVVGHSNNSNVQQPPAVPQAKKHKVAATTRRPRR